MDRLKLRRRLMATLEADAEHKEFMEIIQSYELLTRRAEFTRNSEKAQKLISQRTMLRESWIAAQMSLRKKLLEHDDLYSTLEKEFSVIDAKFNSLGIMEPHKDLIARGESETADRLRITTLKTVKLLSHSCKTSRMTLSDREDGPSGPTRLINPGLCAAPIESPTLKLLEVPDAPCSTALSVRLCAPFPPMPSDLCVVGVPGAVMPGCPLEFFVVPREGYPCTSAEDATVFSESITARVRLSASIFGAAGTAPPVVAVRSFASGCGARVTVPSVWHAPGPTVSLTSVSLDGIEGVVPSFSLSTVRVGANHTAADAGRLWSSANKGDVAGVWAALCDGCSTEEAEDLTDSNAGWSGCMNTSGMFLWSEMREIEEFGKPKAQLPPERPEPREPYVPKPRRKNKTALIAAAQKGHLDVVRMLVDAGADLTAVCAEHPHEYEEVNALEMAVRKDRVSVVRFLLHHAVAGAKLPAALASALHAAVRHRAESTLRCLLADPLVDVNVKTGGSVALIHQLAATDNPTLLSLFISHPLVDVNVQDSDGQRALHHAVWYSLEENVKILLAHPLVDINARDMSGATPLHYAVHSASLVRLFLADRRLNASVQNNAGMTALSIAMHMAKSHPHSSSSFIQSVVLLAVPTRTARRCVIQ